jgi:hypothetical protein
MNRLARVGGRRASLPPARRRTNQPALHRGSPIPRLAPQVHISGASHRGTTAARRSRTYVTAPRSGRVPPARAGSRRRRPRSRRPGVNRRRAPRRSNRRQDAPWSGMYPQYGGWRNQASVRCVAEGLLETYLLCSSRLVAGRVGLRRSEASKCHATCPEFCPYLRVHPGSHESTAYRDLLNTNDFVEGENRPETAENRKVGGSTPLPATLESHCSATTFRQHDFPMNYSGKTAALREPVDSAISQLAAKVGRSSHARPFARITVAGHRSVVASVRVCQSSPPTRRHSSSWTWFQWPVPS